MQKKLIYVLFLIIATSFPSIANAQATLPVVVGAGDISPGSNGAQFQTANLIEAINPVAVLTFGDNQYPDGTLSTFNSYFAPSWGRFKSITRPSPGNHDYHTSGAAGYFDYFNGVGVNTGPAGDRGKGYYSFNVGSWHFISLNSEVMSSTQNAWLASDLAANQNSACTVAYWHHPRFSSGANHGSSTRTAPFWDLLYQYKADIILVGHDHLYERFGPQSPSAVSDPTNGIRQFTVGTGGAGTYSFGTPIANSQVRIATHGIIKLTLHPTSYDWQFINTNSQILDSGTGNCVGTGAPTLTPTPRPSSTLTPTPITTLTPSITPTLNPNNTSTPTPTSTNFKPGDVNHDGQVNIFDFQLLSNSFGKSSGQTGYNPDADFNVDQKVDILDFQILSNNFGR